MERAIARMVTCDRASVVWVHSRRHANPVVEIIVIVLIIMILRARGCMRDRVRGKTGHVRVRMFIAEAWAPKEAVRIVRFVLRVKDIELFAATSLSNEDKGGNGSTYDYQANASEGRCNGALVGKEAT